MSDLDDSPEPATFVETDFPIVDEPVVSASFNDAGADVVEDLPAEDSSAADATAIAEAWSAEVAEVDEESMAGLGDVSADAEAAGWDWEEVAQEISEEEVPDAAPED